MRNLIKALVILITIMLLPSCCVNISADNTLEERITTFLETVFGDQKILDMSNATDD
ncbi:MAG: hypothetical protein AB9835_13730 [Eubacteriales bacterium]